MPQRIRVEALGLWGQPILTLVVDGSIYQAYSRQDDRYFTGDATPRRLSHLLSIPLKAEDLFRLLSGQPPIKPFDHAEASAAREGRGEMLSLYRGSRRLKQRIWFKEDGNVVEQVDVFDNWGHLEYRVCFGDFRRQGSLYHPYAMIISDNEGLLWSLDTERFQAPVSIPDGAFTLDTRDLPDAMRQ
jgi:hypothetical protein